MYRIEVLVQSAQVSCVMGNLRNLGMSWDLFSISTEIFKPVFFP